MQIDLQSPPHRGPGNPNWRKGVSANPSGRTNRQLRTAEYLEQFKRVHGRDPGVVEATLIKNAGALAARVEANTTKVADQVRCGNLLTRLLDRLGLSGARDDKAFPGHGLDKGAP